MTSNIADLDTGTGYGRPKPQHDANLTEVGPGTPMGEVLRRYWHPIAASDALKSDIPHRAKVLGEDLVVFRDGQGRPGVVFERCAHRGSSLFFGRVEDDGIRCCYHGWKFDVQGHCLAQELEPGQGRRRDVVRQPWYPVEERYGLVFVYMGPPDKKPTLPRYDCLETLEEGEQYFASIPFPGLEVVGLTQNYNWLQSYENGLDPVHAQWLHSNHSGYQFDGTGNDGFPESFFDPHTIDVTYIKTEHGGTYHQKFTKVNEDGVAQDLAWSVELQIPNVIALPSWMPLTPGARHDCIIWMVPADDTTHRAYISVRAKSIDRMLMILTGIKQNGKLAFELEEKDLQLYPGDGEAQGSQGPITMHSEETLATTDKGIVMLRRMLRQAVADVAAGRDPQNVTYDPDAIFHVDAGVHHVDADGTVRSDRAAAPMAGNKTPA
ncbi:Rieske 2Fe-2S domain-containing protein [Rhodococcus qingshengii]|uniref:Rieske 2Fe-2S domain-containing protein n=1 Tax=Rhodococcus qingshengii TaxID=334542 RepID=UPI001BE7E9F2|nr:Rieske 2Fe-2S domain-containing protein [Rhodococcus qingshengii]MBT2269958.1 Rieske 2Fe-2S domain-containing protein [Rhodococcus qingshengii]